MYYLRILSFALYLLLVGCAGRVQIEQDSKFIPPQPPATIYVEPFTTVMVPPELQSALFDLFVDQLNRNQDADGFTFVILKSDPQRLDKEWLKNQVLIRGELFAYVEEKGSSTTDIRLKTRLSLFSGKSDATPSLQMNYPIELFFENDYMSIDKARAKIATRTANLLSHKLLQTLSPPPNQAG